MSETVESVFGVKGTSKGTVPDEFLAKLKEYSETYGADGTKVRDMYVDALNNPAIAKDAAPFLEALRAVRAQLSNPVYGASKGYTLLYWPSSVSGKSFHSKKDGSWRAQFFGWAFSASPELGLEGPATLVLSGIPSEEEADAIRAAPLHAVYKVHGSPGSKDPVGTLSPGVATTVFVNGGKVPEAVALTEAADVAYWSSIPTRLLEHFPKSALSELLLTPHPNQYYRIEGNVIAAHSSVDPNTNAPRGNMTLVDDTVTKELEQKNRGGLFFFLPSTLVQFGALPIGSRITALIQGYEAKVKDSSGAYTGESRVNWQPVAMQVLLDLSGGTVVPDPSKVAVSTEPAVPTPSDAEW